MEGDPLVNMASLVVAIPQFGIVAKPNPDGGYLLTGVPPGTLNVQLLGPGIRESRETIHLTYVGSRATTVGIDFVVRGVNTPAPQVQPGVLQKSTQPSEKQNIIDAATDRLKDLKKSGDPKKP
jgi:hypothetical protein